MPGSRKGLPPQEAPSESVAATTTITDGTAALRRDEGMATALDAVQPAWRFFAEEALDRLIASGVEFTSDDVRDVAGDPFATGSARALGGMINGRFRRGEIVPVGFTASRQPQRHKGYVRRWVQASEVTR